MAMTFRLRNGVQLPAVGLGTWQAKGESLVRAVQWALDAGIGHIDTALSYKVRCVRRELVKAGLHAEC